MWNEYRNLCEIGDEVETEGQEKERMSLSSSKGWVQNAEITQKQIFFYLQGIAEVLMIMKRRTTMLN